MQIQYGVKLELTNADEQQKGTALLWTNQVDEAPAWSSLKEDGDGRARSQRGHKEEDAKARGKSESRSPMYLFIRKKMR